MGLDTIQPPGSQHTPQREQHSRKAVWLTASDAAEWDAFVLTHPLGQLSHLTAWKHLLEQSFPHIRGGMLVLRDPASSRIVAGLPVYAVRSWLLGNRVVSVPFASLSDPLVSSAQDLPCLLPHVIAYQKSVSARSVEIKTFRAERLFQPSHDQISSIAKHHYIALDRTREEVWQTLSRTAVRRMVKKAEQAQVTVRLAEGEADWRAFYGLYAQTRRRLCLPPQPFKFFSALSQVLPPAYRTLFLAFDHGRAVAGVLAFKFGTTYLIEFYGEEEETSGSGVNQFLYWTAIQEALQEGFKVFSFGRTASTNYGLLRYKRHWGTVEEDLVTFCYPSSAPGRAVQREVHWSYNVFKAVVRRAPPGVHNLIGRIFYRHWG